MDRRTFLSWVGVGFLASSMPVAIAACQAKRADAASPDMMPADNPPLASGTTPPDDLTVALADKQSGSHHAMPIGTVADLDKNGFLSGTLPFAQSPVIVIRNPADRNKLLAVDSYCPHKGCAVKWKADKKEYDCPCHGSKFGPDGSLRKGPAKKPLTPFTARIEGSQVVVSHM